MLKKIFIILSLIICMFITAYSQDIEDADPSDIDIGDMDIGDIDEDINIVSVNDIKDLITEIKRLFFAFTVRTSVFPNGIEAMLF